MSPAAAAEVVIAVPSTGGRAVDGMRDAVDHFTADLNRSGRLGGITLRIEHHDNFCNRDAATEAARLITASRAVAVVGQACATPTTEAAALYQAAGIPLILIGATAVHGHGAKSPAGTLLYLPAVSIPQGRFIGQQVAALMAVTNNARAAIVSDRTRWALGIAREAGTAIAEYGAGSAKIESFAGGDKDFTALAARLAAAGTTHVVLAAFGSEAGLFVADLIRTVPGIVVVGTETLAGPEFARAAGSAASSVRIAMRPDIQTLRSQNSAARLLIDSLGRDTLPAIRATLATAAAIEVVGEAAARASRSDAALTPQAITTSLMTSDAPFASVLGPVTFDISGNASLPAWRLYRWLDGRLTAVQQ